MDINKALSVSSVLLAAIIAFTVAGPARSQTSWGQRATPVTPPARALHVLVHDPIRRRTLMFGGHNPILGDLGDTWEWDGSRWLQVFPGQSPAPRHAAMACFDETRGTIVLFGGSNVSAQSMGDTWEWNGSNWIPLTNLGPSQRGWGGLAFDYANGHPVLFSGVNSGGGAPIQDMWVFSNGAWQQVTVQPLPPGNTAFIFCSDPRRREIVLQGGSYNGGPTNQCWVWNGIAWNAATSRGLYDKSSAAYDPIRRRIVAFGGGVQSQSADTWEWDGTAWLQRSPGLSPSPRGGPSMAFDTVSDRMLLFGGGNNSNVYNSETWEYFLFTPASYESYGQGCPGTNQQIPLLDPVDGVLPWIGEDWQLDLRDIPAHPAVVPFGLIGSSRTLAYGNPLPLDLGSIGMPGCFLLMSGDEVTTPLTNAGGIAPWTVHFPLDLRLIGTHHYLQAAVLDPGVNALGLTLSNAGHACIGMK